MIENLEPITFNSHKNTKIKAISDYSFLKPHNVAALLVNEFVRAASSFPIIFIKKPETDDFTPAVLMGIGKDQNIYVEDGKWMGTYTPAVIQKAPFALAKNQEDTKKLTICLDKGSELVNEEEGEALFEESGQATPFLQRTIKSFEDLHKMEVLTDLFCKYLKDKEMFSPINMKFKGEEKVKQINGCFIINEERLNILSDDTFLEMRKHKFLTPIYAHLTSLGQMERFAHS